MCAEILWPVHVKITNKNVFGIEDIITYKIEFSEIQNKRMLYSSNNMQKRGKKTKTK